LFFVFLSFMGAYRPETTLGSLVLEDACAPRS
jgi:hypothetical protein